MDKNKLWRRQAMSKSKHILQVWVKDGWHVHKQYEIPFIPHFFIIDPKGKITNAQMPLPSDQDFETILQKEIPMQNYTYGLQ